MVDILQKLINAVSVSGSEEGVSKIIEGLIEGYADTIRTDALGNLIALKKSGLPDAKKIMIASHMDEIGFIVTFIEETGFIRVAPVGWINWAAASFGEVLFKNGLRGVLVPESKIYPNDYSAQNMYIDIGAKDGDDAGKKIKIGDMCTVAPKIVELINNRIAASKLDDKIACAILIKTLQNFKNIKPPYDLYFVFTAQEELGLRGALTAAQAIGPDYSIAVDVTATGDTPECHPMALKIGAGAAIKIMDSSVICHKDMVNLFLKTAAEKNIPHQSEILTQGGTDTSAMQAAGAGSVAGALSVPTRYIHSGVELCSINDVTACADLLYASLENIINLRTA